MRHRCLLRDRLLDDVAKRLEAMHPQQSPQPRLHPVEIRVMTEPGFPWRGDTRLIGIDLPADESTPPPPVRPPAQYAGAPTA